MMLTLNNALFEAYYILGNLLMVYFTANPYKVTNYTGQWLHWVFMVRI